MSPITVVVLESDEELRSSDEYPSPLIDVEIGPPAGNGSAYRIQIPKRELFRVRNVLLKGEYALPNRHVLRGSSPIIVDVGANIGVFALYMKAIFPGCMLHCFEPVPSTVSLLRRNLASFQDVHIHPYALSNESSESEILLHRHNTGQNSLKRIESAKQYSSSQNVSVRAAGNEFDRLNLNHIDVLKIDTEGCEFEILKSLGERLERVKYVMLEYHSDEDRRRIDACLSDFSIYGAVGVQLNRGTLKYQNRLLL